MDIFDFRSKRVHRFKISPNTRSMENSLNMLGSKGLINKQEFVRVIIQCLYSLGYKKSASCLESESSIRYKSVDFDLLESQILSGDWDNCIDTVNRIKDLKDDTRSSVLFLVLKHCFLEYLNRGDDSLALSVLQKQVPTLHMSKEMVHKLAYNIFSLKEMELGKLDEDIIFELRKRLVMELGEHLPPPIVLPERRLEHLVETSVVAQIDSCMHHNSQDVVSLYEDHCCGRDQIPTKTVQVCFLLQSILLFH